MIRDVARAWALFWLAYWEYLLKLRIRLLAAAINDGDKAAERLWEREVTRALAKVEYWRKRAQ